MPKNINSASRLTAILKAIPAHPDNTQVMSVWANHFGISESNPHKQSMKVAERLAAMNRELTLIQVQMQAGNFSESLYSNSIASIEQCYFYPAA